MSIDVARELLEENLDRLGGLGYKIRFKTPGGETLAIDAAKRPPAILDGDEDEDEEVDCTIRISAGDLVKLLAGDLNPTLAYSMGKLKVDGSMGVALKLASILDE